jgi:aminopeptidase N
VLAFKKFYGAMENTQMVVLNEHHVLYDKDSQTLDYKRDLFAQIGHEIAHQVITFHLH